MPEGPEVKISCDIIKPWLKNKLLTGFSFSEASKYRNKNPKHYQIFIEKTINKSKVTDVTCHGKKIYIIFDNNWIIENGFGMTGLWSQELDKKHNCFTIETYKSYYFNDVRHFANINFYLNSATYLFSGIDLLKHDKISSSIIDDIYAKIKNKKIAICNVLMDQDVFPGVGNYIRAEALYLARMNPFILCNKLTFEEIKNLIICCHKIMHASYQAQGASIKDFKTPAGENGKYSFKFNVYGLKKDKNGFDVIKTAVKNRTLHWVKEIQQGSQK